MPQYEDVYEPPMLDSTGQAIANAIQGLNPTVPSFISDAFSVERSYSTGDIVIYENKVYVFTSNKSAGAWDSTKVTETTIGAICTATNASLTNITSVNIGDKTVLYKLGKIRILSGMNGTYSITSSGIDLGGDTVATPCYSKVTYYNGSANVEGYLHAVDGKVYLTASNTAITNGSYITGSIVFIVN